MTNFKDRAQFQSPVSGKWLKVNLKTGRIIQIKQTPGPFNKVKIMEWKDL